jgi:DNA-binding beta-propeller fold protein YncE
VRSHAKAPSAGSSMPWRGALAALLSLLALALLGATPALGAQLHKFAFSFGSAGSGNGEFANNTHLAVDQTSGDVYVADTGNGRVQKFDEDGNFLAAFGAVDLTTPTFLAVDNSSGPSQGDLYVADAAGKEVLKYDPSGNLITSWAVSGRLDGSDTGSLGPFRELSGIAVDPVGTLYVLDTALMFRFAEDSTFLGAFGFHGSGGAGRLAVDSTGAIYRSSEGNEVEKWKLGFGAELIGSVDPGPANGIAVDPSNDDLYVAHPDHVRVYDSTGAVKEGNFGSGQISAATAIAVRGSDARVYVSDSGSSEVKVYEAAIGANVTTGPATAITPKTATLTGQVDPLGIAVSDCHFTYASQAEWQANGFSLEGAAEIPCDPDPGSGNGEVEVSADLSGLAPGTTYFFRLQATNVNGTIKGAETSFATAPAVKDLTTLPASALAPNTATLNGSLDPDGLAISDCHFTYASEAEFIANGFTLEGAPEAPCVPDPGSGSGPVAVAADLSDLDPSTRYFFRLQATNAIGTTKGGEEILETLPAVKDLATGAAIQITASAATLNGSLDPDGLAISDCHFSYATQAEFETNGFNGATEAPCVPDPGSGSGPVQVTAALSGLSEATIYHYRLSATNSFGTTNGSEASFETDGVPLISHTASANLGVSSAELRAEVNPHGEQTTYRFEYGPSTSYGNSIPVPDEAIGSGDVALAVSQALSGLAPDTLYHFRVVAANANGTVAGPDRTFHTHAIPNSPGNCPNEAIRIEQASTHLPRCMAYELISPLESLGNDTKGTLGLPDGEHAVISTLFPITPDQSAGNINAYLAKRTPTGWRLQDLGIPGQNRLFDARAYAADGSATIVESCSTLILNCAAGPYALERVEGSGARTTMVSRVLSIKPRLLKVAGGSDDAHWLFFERDADDGGPPIAPGDSHDAGRGIYASHDGELEYLAVDENGAALPCGAVIANNHGARTAKGFQQSGISADGRTVAFESPDPLSGCAQPTGVYVRRDGQTVNISRPRNGNPDEGAIFAGASRDGELTYFTTASQLVVADTDSEPDIYAYDLTSDTQRLISGGVGVTETNVAVSPQGDYVYFKSRNTHEGEGTDGLPNLYVYHAGEIRFIATASEGEFRLEGGIGGNANTAITPDGTHLLFNSSDPLSSGRPTGGSWQIFQYSYEEDAMSCISCPPDGSVPVGEVLVRLNDVNQRVQSDDGSAVAFAAGTALLPSDLNGNSPDVYLWRRDAPLALISSGRGEASASSSPFRGMSADGNSVFLETPARLVPEVRQDNVKVYVARVNGGFTSPPSPPTPCLGEACRPGAPAPPSGASPSSASFSGPANPRPKRGAHKKHRRKKAQKKRASKRAHGKKAQDRAAKSDRGGRK